jgi:hypothetical protein
MDAPVETRKRGPGRPKKEVVEEYEVPTDKVTPEPKEFADPALVEPLQVVEIKHVIRTLNWAGEDKEGSQPGYMIEDYLNQNYFSQGYTLQGVYTLEIVKSIEDKAFGNTLLYVLVKYAQ